MQNTKYDGDVWKHKSTYMLYRIKEKGVWLDDDVMGMWLDDDVMRGVPHKPSYQKFPG